MPGTEVDWVCGDLSVPGTAVDWVRENLSVPGTAVDWVCGGNQSPQFPQASATTAYAY